MQEFSTKWNFPGCVGAIDGKHVHLFPPHNSGSFYYNYKEGFSIVLLALVDANYKFIAIDVGANGRACDAGIWQKSEIRKAIVEKQLNIPAIIHLPNSDKLTPPVLVGDSGFGLDTTLMRPYIEKGITMEERIFNYRLSRARRVSENAFGILANRWRILLSRMMLSPEKATKLVLACCALHNMMRTVAMDDQIYMYDGILDFENQTTGELKPGKWGDIESLESLRKVLIEIHHSRQNQYVRTSKNTSIMKDE